MMTNNVWIRVVDHRISTALILFLLLVLSQKKKKAMFPLRAGGSLVFLCLSSWLMRTVIDEMLIGVFQQGMGYSVYLLVMSLLFMVSYNFCYRVSMVELMHADLLALTIYKLAWNTFKVFATASHVFHMSGLWSTYSIMGSIVSYAVYGMVCLPAYFFYRNVVGYISSDMPQKPIRLTLTFFLFCQLVLEFCGRVLTADPGALFLYYLCALMYTAINYALLLAFMRLVQYKRRTEDMQSFIENKMRYYQMSKDGITSLQIKCHDLKHQIAAVRSQAGKDHFEQYLDRLEDSIMEYGTVVECGNETINTVLTEKNILSAANGVKFSYMLDGSLFDFMSEMEIYSLFGNALDNALESCSKVKDPAMRVISLKANARGSMVVLHVENCFDEPPTLIDGMPVTSKKESGHGLGLRSIQQIAEKYSGTVSVQIDGQFFKLNVILNP